ncbi:MAG: DnaD domain protein [Solobacterium sp.]|nr:DnaD domain protein [Solobacterium sp.]MBR2767563.1 DnaD domain protein [Solobacterium sp.]
MKWYDQHFVNRRDWILDHLEQLGLSHQETVMVLVIDFMNENRLPISIESLHAKTGMSTDEVNEVISLLCAKKYLEIRASAKRVSFLLNGLFETDTAREANVLDTSLFELFESVFKRPLTQREMEQISEWNRIYDKRMIILALKEAGMYQALKMPYVAKVLSEWSAKGLSVDDIEKGVKR